jgi:arylsulfatase A-like enzyme
VAWSLPSLGVQRLGEYATDILTSTHEDVVFAAVCGLLAQALLARARPRFFGPLLLALGAVVSIFAVASVVIFEFLRSPLTYRLLYLAGDPKAMRSSIQAFVTPGLVAAFLLVPTGWVLWARRTARWPLPARPWRRRLVVAALVAAQAGFGWWTYNRTPWGDRSDHLIARNPHVALVASVVDVALGRGAPGLEESFPPAFLADFEPLPPLVPGRAPRPRPRNVIVIVMETTGTRYLSLYGSRYATTPHLVEEAQHALVFDAHYCHVGMSANSMAAILLGVYPYMTWREYTVEYPDLPGTTLANLLEKKGYRTAYLHSGDLSYVGQDAFLKTRGFQVIKDSRQLSSTHTVSSWGAEDKVLFDGLLEYIDEKDDRPFFVLGWTAQSHHPYEPSAGRELIDFFGKDMPPDDWDLGRYLNTLSAVDEQLGRLFDGLRQRGLDRNTLVVLTGDHGEAFGSPHPAWGHGARLHEELVQVPLVMWSPTMFPKGRRVATIGGHVDINPTLAEVLGLPGSPDWHGRSLFEPGRPPRAYFYAANDDYFLGVRHEEWKYVYNLTRGREELFHLPSDPDELKDVAAEHPELCQMLRQRLSAWRDFVGRHLATMRGES